MGSSTRDFVTRAFGRYTGELEINASPFQKREGRAYRMPRLAEDLSRAHALQRRSTLLKQLAKTDVLLLDDFGLASLSDQHKRDLLEILDDRYDKRSTIVTSQLPIEEWHAYLGDPTLADAILDRLVHNAHKLNLKGESMRKRRAIDQEARPAAH